MDMDDELKGVDAKTGINRRGQTRAHIAAAFGDAELLAAEMGRGADLGAKDNAGHTPLMAAALSGSASCVDEILASPRHCAREADHEGWTALMHAARNDDRAVVEKLLPKSNSQAANMNGQKASDVARDCGFPALATRIEDLEREKFKRDIAGHAARNAERLARAAAKEEPLGL